MFDLPGQRLADAFERAVAWLIANQPLGFGDAAIRAMSQVVPGVLRVSSRDRGSVLLPRDKSQLRWLPEPRSQ